MSELPAFRVFCDGTASKNTYCNPHARDLAVKTRRFFPDAVVEVKLHGKAAQPCCICGRGGAK